MLVQVTEGVPFTFSHLMVAVAGSGVEGASDVEDVSAYGYDTSYLAISGVDYTSASGFIYPTSLPVETPEPSSFLILMGSLIGFGFIGRRLSARQTDVVAQC